MARNNTQRYEPTITLNSKAAENALDGLKIKAKQVRDALREAGNMGDDRKVRELERELKGIESSQRQIKQQTYDYNTVLRNLNTSSIKDLQKTARSLKNEIKTLTPGHTGIHQQIKTTGSGQVKVGPAQWPGEGDTFMVITCRKYFQ